MARYGDSFWDMVKDIRRDLNDAIKNEATKDNPNYKFTNRNIEILYRNILIYIDKGYSDLRDRFNSKKMKKIVGGISKNVKVEALDFNNLEITVGKGSIHGYLYYTNFIRDDGFKLRIKTYGSDKEATGKKHEKIVKVATKGSEWVRGRTCLFPA